MSNPRTLAIGASGVAAFLLALAIGKVVLAVLALAVVAGAIAWVLRKAPS